MYFPEKVLQFLNMAREAFALSPLERIPDGVPKDPERCPIANALKEIGVEKVWKGLCECHSDVASTLAATWGTMSFGNGLVILPEELRRFIDTIDGGDDDE